jgi:hypothetical protein
VKDLLESLNRRVVIDRIYTALIWFAILGLFASAFAAQVPAEPQINEQQAAFDAVVADMRARCDVNEGLERIEARLAAIEKRLKCSTC